MTLPDRIRQALGPTHAAIEQTAFAAGMIGGTVSPAAYTHGLAQLGHIHAALEDALAARPEPAFAAVYHPAEMVRTGAILADLIALGDDADATPTDATEHLCAAVREWATASPWKLLGALYVVEGSRMGSMALVRPLSKALGVDARPGTGLDYHLAQIGTRPQTWQRFRGTLAALPLTDAQQADVLAGATETMAGLLDLYAALPVAEPVAV